MFDSVLKVYMNQLNPNQVNIYLKEAITGQDHKREKYILKSFYDEVYSAGVYHPRNSAGMWFSILKLNPKFDKGLEVGCGPGYGIKFARSQGQEIWGIDLADIRHIWKKLGIDQWCQVADASDIPYDDDMFDFVVCTEVLEHIPEWDVINALKEMYRVGTNLFVFSVALQDEVQPIPMYFDPLYRKNMHTHITIQPSEWWVDKLLEVGYDVEVASSTDESLMVEARKW